jgi:hypothetical protein
MSAMDRGMELEGAGKVAEQLSKRVEVKGTDTKEDVIPGFYAKTEYSSYA